MMPGPPGSLCCTTMFLHSMCCLGSLMLYGTNTQLTKVIHDALLYSHNMPQQPYITSVLPQINWIQHKGCAYIHTC